MIDPHEGAGQFLDQLVELAKDASGPDHNPPSGDQLSPGFLGGIFAEEVVEVDPLEEMFESDEEEVVDYSLVEHGANLAEYLEERDLQSLAHSLQDLYKDDKQSRSGWESAAADGMELLGLEIKPRKDEPFKGASGVIDPVITEAIIKFQSNAVQEIFGTDGPVDVKIWGKIDDVKRERAIRKKDYMNHVLTTVIDDYREETEKLLWDLAYCGSAFRKIYPNTETGEPEAQYYPAERVIIPYNYPNLWKAPRYSCIVDLDDMELKRLQQTGVYRDIAMGSPTMEALNEVQTAKDEITKQDRPVGSPTSRIIVEMYCRLNLVHFDDPDGIASPYIVTFEEGTGRVLAIRRNWKETDPKKRATHWMVQYTFIPGPGSYGFGYIHLIGNLAKASTSMLRLLMDAGVLSTFVGGLAEGLRTKDGVIRPKLGEFVNCDIAGGTIGDHLFPLPYKEPSQTLAVLRDGVKADAKVLASIADPEIAANGEVPVGTIIALLQEKQKVMTAIQARLHRALKKEFAILDRVISDQLSDAVENDEEKEYPYEVVGGERFVKLADFRDTLTCQPVSDPNMATFSLQFLKHKYALEISAQAPGIYNLPKLHKTLLNFLNIKDVDELIPDKDANIPVRDPRSEVAALLMGEPVKAFPWQDHKSHASVISSFLQDPQMKQQLSQMPQGNQIFASANAALAERMAYIYSRQIEEELGVPLPPLDEPMPPEIEISLSGAMAEAERRRAEKAQQAAAQQKAQQEAQDPLNIIQKKDLEIKQFAAQSNAELRKQEIAATAQAKAEAEQTKRMKIQSDMAANAKESANELAWVQMELQKFTNENPLLQAQIQEALAKITKVRADTALVLQQIADMKSGGNDGTIQ